MGFKIGRTFILDFEGTDLAGEDGARIKMRSASIGELKKLPELTLEEECDFFASKVVEWNLEDEDGNPLPREGSSFLSMEEPLRDLICKEYLKATRGVTAPLDRRSSAGRQSEELSIPMETL